jgi:hypothetical protein
MQRRSLIAACAFVPSIAALPVRFAFAHHGWSGYDGARPLYLEGRVAMVRWTNPHAHIEVEPVAGLRLPEDLAERKVPAQQASVDAAKVLAAAQLPKRRGERWTLELAPLFRMSAWNIEPLEVGETVSLIGYAAPDEQGPAVMRVEFLFANGKAYGLRSAPA